MRIKEFRKANNLTTIELGKMVGVAPSAVTNWETGARRPNIDMLIRLTEIFDCTADELLGIDRKKPEPEDEAPRTRESFAEIVQRRTEEARRGAAE